ncbi:MAG: hypothetical protein GY821_02855 [Gammaproteobacteria bacterium]|nr:hypothetical protein [Gammaproteobacteria bacterium]
MPQLDQNNGNNDTLLDQRAFHYLDYTADGWVAVAVTGLDLDTFPAYSLLSAPDFYPAVTQRSLMEWGAQAQQSEPWQDSRIWQTDPVDLSSDRRPADLELKNSNNQPLFSSNDDTITAVVSHFNSPRYQPMDSIVFTQSKNKAYFRHRCLPDAAAGVFAPGWEGMTSF